MKKLYNVGEDLFIAGAFVTFVVGGMLSLLGINVIFKVITTRGLIILSITSLLFSMALSLYEIAHHKQ